MSDYYQDQVNDLFGSGANESSFDELMEFYQDPEMSAIEEEQEPIAEDRSYELLASSLTQAMDQMDRSASSRFNSVTKTETVEEQKKFFVSDTPKGADEDSFDSLFDDVEQLAPVADGMVENLQHGFGTTDSSIVFAPLNNENHQVASNVPAAFGTYNNGAEEYSQLAFNDPNLLATGSGDGVENFQFTFDGFLQSAPNAHNDFMANDQSLFAQDASQPLYQYQDAPINNNNDQLDFEQFLDGLNSFDSSEQQQSNWADQTDNAVATSFTPESVVEDGSTDGINNVPTTEHAEPKALPSWYKEAGLDKQNLNAFSVAPVPDFGLPAEQPVSALKPAPGRMNVDQMKDALIKVTGSFALSILRSTLDAPTKTSTQRHLLRIVNSFGLDGNSNITVPEQLRKSLDGIWTMFNSNQGYQKMFLTYIIEKVLKQHPECGPLPLYNGINFNSALEDMAGELEAKVNSLDPNDPQLIVKARDLLVAEFIHRSQLLEASKAVTQTAVNETKVKYQHALQAKHAELDATKTRADALSAQTKKSVSEMQQMESNMKSMQSKIQQMTTQLSGMYAQLADSNERSRIAHDMNVYFMDSATPEQIAAASSASSTSSPSQSLSHHQRSLSYPSVNYTTTPPPAQQFYQPDTLITPPASKKRKTSSDPDVQNFYQCLKITTKGSICGVINTQVTDKRSQRQRCYPCRKYTDIKDKAWVADETAMLWGVGNQAPLDITMKGASLLAKGAAQYDMGATPVQSPAAASAPVPVFNPGQKIGVQGGKINTQQSDIMQDQQFPNQHLFTQQVANKYNTPYNQQTTPRSYDSPYGSQPYVQPDMTTTQPTMNYTQPTMTYNTQTDMTKAQSTMNHTQRPTMNYNIPPYTAYNTESSTPSAQTTPTSPSTPLASIPNPVAQKSAGQPVQVRHPIPKPAPGHNWPKHNYVARGGQGLTLPTPPQKN